jgi:hypothetical protein
MIYSATPNRTRKEEFPMAKKTAKEKAKSAPKRTAKSAPKRTTQRAGWPRREDVPGYSPGSASYARWPDVAIALHVEPFYQGPGAVPFSRLRCHLVPDPADRNIGKNDFYLEGAAG